MPDIPAEGAHVRLWLASGRVIDCRIGTEVGEGRVTVLPDGRSEGDWERIRWTDVWTVRPLEGER